MKIWTLALAGLLAWTPTHVCAQAGPPGYPTITAAQVQPTGDMVELNGTRFVYNTFLTMQQLARFVALQNGSVGAGTAGQVPFYAADGNALTPISASPFAAGLPIIGAGSSGLAAGTKSGSSTLFPVIDGTSINGQCAVYTASGGLTSQACTASGSGTVGAGLKGNFTFYNADGAAVVGSSLDYAANNTQLRALASTSAAFAVRQSFANPGDAPPVTYRSSSSPCTLNSGAGDNGWQVPSSDSKCWIAVFDGHIDVREFGVVGDGATDNHTAIQSAVTAACVFSAGSSGADSSELYFPSGKFNYSVAITLAAGCEGLHLTGDGPNSTLLQPNAGINGINVLSANQFTSQFLLDKFQINYVTPATTGIFALHLDAASAVLAGITVRDVTINNPYDVIYLGNAVFATIDNVKAYTVQGIGVLATSSVANVDNGDSTITNSTFFAYTNQMVACVDWQSSGGLRFVNNKCGFMQYGVLGQLITGGVSTAQMIVANNSFDTVSAAGVSLSRQGTTGTFGNVIVNNNIFTGALIGTDVPHDTTGAWLTLLQFNSNTFIGSSVAGGGGLIVDSTNNVMAIGNNFISNNASTTAMQIGAAVVGCTVGASVKNGAFTASFNGAGCTTIAPF